MLTYFEVQGFKKFSNAISMNFKNVKDYQFNPECIKDKIINKAIIYGKNGSGKSSLGLAMLDITAHLDDNNMPPDLYRNYVNWNGEVAQFKYNFRFDDDIIEYSYSKCGIKNLKSEKMTLNNKVLLDYDYDLKKGNFTGFEEMQPTLNFEYKGDGSILRYILNNLDIDKNHALRKFKQFVSKMLWCRTLDQKRYVGYKNSSDDYLTFIFEDGNIDKFQTILDEIGIRERLAVRTNAEGGKVLCIEKNGKYLQFLSVASSGTMALFTFFYWYTTAHDASFIYLDEFDAYYHLELTEYIICMLKKMSSAQVVVTTHNTNLFSNNIMRPDCYFILGDTLNAAYSTTNRELREGHNLQKLYLAGEFNGQKKNSIVGRGDEG